MQNTFTVSSLRANNARTVLKNIYLNKFTTPLMLHETTSLSRPTIAQIIKELQQEELIYIRGLADSTGGRKANLYAFNATIRISIGVEILIDHFEIAAIDLYGDLIKFEKDIRPYENTNAYFDHLCNSINSFIDSLNYPPEKILGVGIALQALISADGKNVIYGKILDCTGLTIDTFEKNIAYPCTFIHDAESMANVELWFDPALQNAIFLNIRTDVSGAIIINRSYFQSGAYKSGIIEHMTLIPNGLPCYCGKRGCVNAYCSISSLLKAQEDIQYFFTLLRNGNSSYEKRWNQYLTYLATTIDNLHMAINSNIIIGGTLAHYMEEDDIQKLYEIILNKTAFPTEENYISISTCADKPACIGAALPFVQTFLETL